MRSIVAIVLILALVGVAVIGTADSKKPVAPPQDDQGQDQDDQGQDQDGQGGCQDGQSQDYDGDAPPTPPP